jgi:hypothetical protein
MALYSGFVPALSGSVLFRAIPFVGISGTDRFLRERDVLTDQPIGGWLVLLCCTKNIVTDWVSVCRFVAFASESIRLRSRRGVPAQSG